MSLKCKNTQEQTLYTDKRKLTEFATNDFHTQFLMSCAEAEADEIPYLLVRAVTAGFLKLNRLRSMLLSLLYNHI